ncbi:carboxypeptidase [Bacillus phage W.Ph.]|uniref:Gp127 n=1 Tax=Bacillus phage W.Ph. TaxID=764595 RepID=G9B1M8_9CAUD|nr:carboxypeptidase [Bacillus phage W.Ph.]ADH03273.1 gp127 [Bacillus phage W.Ph.]
MTERKHAVTVGGCGSNDTLMVEVYNNFATKTGYAYNYIKVEDLKEQLKEVNMRLIDDNEVKDTRMFRVYKMNDCDHVAARDEKEAKEYYINECGIDEIAVNEDFVGEVPLSDTMLFDVNDVPLEDYKLFNFELTEVYGSKYFRVPFWYAIPNMNIKEPVVICSTEAF